jgi:hypothetical protein
VQQQRQLEMHGPHGNGTKRGSGPSGLKVERRKFLHFIFLLFTHFLNTFSKSFSISFHS